jgi:anthranilate 1,2-dioxygenase small subunit
VSAAASADVRAAVASASPQVRDRIDQLNIAYARCLDDCDLERWPDFFTEPCLYKIYPRENLEEGLPGSVLFFDSQAMLRDRVLCIREVNLYAPHNARHLLGRPEVEARSDGAFGVRTNLMVVHTDHEGHSELFAVGEYRDLVVEINGALRFREKVVILDTFTVRSHLAEPL